jgi:hypothetical protein
MAISFIGSAAGNAINGANVTLTLPSMNPNDLVIVAYTIGDNDNLDFDLAMVTAGYNEVADLAELSETIDSHLGVFYKFMPATPDATAEVDGQGGTDAGVSAVAMVFRGVDTASPFDVARTVAQGGNGNRPNPPSIDWATAGTWVVIAGACSTGSGAGATMTNPTGYTTDAISRAGGDTTDCLVGMGYKSSPADPEDPGIMTPSFADNVNDAWTAVTMALRVLSSSTFPQSFSETWSASEALTRKQILKTVITETWQAAETLVTDAVLTFKQTITETWSAAESLVTKLVSRVAFSETWQAAETLVTQYIVAPLSAAIGFLRRIFTKQS